MKDQIFIILCIIVVSFCSFPKDVDIIRSDGQGYYEYLPSIFIHQDLDRKDLKSLENHRVEKLDVYVDYKEKRLNKYSIGSALLMSPFFGISYLFADQSKTLTGYEKGFQIGMFASAIFYLLCSLLIFKKILIGYEIPTRWILFIQIIMVFATSLWNYASYECTFSHVYSLFAILGFIYYTRSFFMNTNSRSLVMTFLFFGLVLIIRPVNGIVLLFIPFLASSKRNMIDGIRFASHKTAVLFMGIIIVFLILSIQFWAWNQQVGEGLVYSYQGESFNFSEPEILKILFSFRKGLFVYTPVLLLSFMGFLVLYRDLRKFELISWLIAFIALVFVFSSWWSWYYGGSFGHRAFIEFYPFFFILIAIGLNKLRTSLRCFIVIFGLLLIPFTQIQAYQYRHYILHNSEMNFHKYWSVFLKTSEDYEGILFGSQHDVSNCSLLAEGSVDRIKIIPNYRYNFYEIELNKIPTIGDLQFLSIQYSQYNAESTGAKLGIALTLNDSIVNYQLAPLTHFDMNEQAWNKGSYTFDFRDFAISGQEKLIGFLESKEKAIELNDITWNFYGKK